jgi:hypothetical protein
MITRIWHGRNTPSRKRRVPEYLNLMRTVAIPDYRSTPGNKGAYALRRMEGVVHPKTPSQRCTILTRRA